MSDEAIISFVESLAARYPEVRKLLDEHANDNFGEILPHVFFGDVTRHTVSLAAAARSGSSEAQQSLRMMLDLFEERFSNGPKEVADLLSVSFLENLPRPGEEGSEIRELIGPNLRKELEVIG